MFTTGLSRLYIFIILWDGKRLQKRKYRGSVSLNPKSYLLYMWKFLPGETFSPMLPPGFIGENLFKLIFCPVYMYIDCIEDTALARKNFLS